MLFNTIIIITIL